jgi:Spx/MgsR family transcriptional regulator
MTRLHGIPNCDTVKRARAWLAEQHVDHEFHDFKKAGVPAGRLDTWIAALGWERLVNRQGTTWRKLPDDVKAGVIDAPSARRLMLDQPSVIKRPVVEWDGGEVTVGFEPARWSTLAKHGS